MQRLTVAFLVLTSFIPPVFAQTREQKGPRASSDCVQIIKGTESHCEKFAPLLPSAQTAEQKARQDTEPAPSRRRPPVDGPIVRIEYGSFGGMCFGYSYSQTIIQAKMMRSILLTHDSLNGNRDIEHPDQESKRNITKEQWERAKAAVDTESFFALPDMMGCPGCRDEPADWITVKYRDGTTKSVMCNRGYCPTTDTKYEIKTALAQGTHGDVPLKRPQSLCPTLGQ